MLSVFVFFFSLFWGVLNLFLGLDFSGGRADERVRYLLPVALYMYIYSGHKFLLVARVLVAFFS